jgi:hypothetical protein
LKIAPLTPADAARFSQAWNTFQGRFIDGPRGVVVEADRLVQEQMIKRAYPKSSVEVRELLGNE